MATRPIPPFMSTAGLAQHRAVRKRSGPVQAVLRALRNESFTLVFCSSVATVAGQVTGSTLFVNAAAPAGGTGLSWPSAYNDLQTALTAALPPSGVSEIRVAQGTYHPTVPGPNPRFWTFQLIERVAIRGGYAGVTQPDPDLRDPAQFPTILDGSIPGKTFACYNVTRCEFTNSPTEIDGLVIRDGSAVGPAFTNDRGGGLFAAHCQLRVTDCVFEWNSTSNAGGAIWANNADLILVGCTLANNVNFGNSSAGIHNVFGSYLVLRRCRFVGNSVLTGHTGGAAIFNGGYTPSVIDAVDCTFLSNFGPGNGGAVYNAGHAAFTNCLFASNAAFYTSENPEYSGRGGAVANFATVSLTNCTFTANEAGVAAGAVFTLGGQINNNQPVTDTTITNCILWDNTATGTLQEQQLQHGIALLIVNYSCVMGLTPSLGGTGNIGSDPMFVDPAGFDFRLSARSPCSDAASNSAVPDGVCGDLDRGPRFRENPFAANSGQGAAPIVDMGAYEVGDCTLTGDVDCDGAVGINDLLFIIQSWGLCSGCCAGDLDADGLVNIDDMLLVIANWS